MPENSNRYLIVAGGTGKGLLGKRAALNFMHEWQIDVESEKFSDDTAHFSFIPLDTFIGTSTALAHYYISKAEANANKYPHESPYISTRANTSAVKNHTSVYWKNVGAAMLKFGLAQEPAMGAGAARHPDNEKNLRAKLARIRDGAGTDTTVEIWIVSSTAGGTGQGIHRYIAALVADILSTANTYGHFHFVQIGQETYGTAGDRCTLNTFLGVAADVAFSHTFSHKREEADRANVPAWYYLDLKDVGTGESAKKLRAELVEMSIKTILNKNVSIDLNKLVINNQGLPFVLARTGFWGKDFDETSKYKQTLNATATKLKQLLMPAEDMPERAKQLVTATAEADKPKFRETTRYSAAIERAQDRAVIEKWLAAENKIPVYPPTAKAAAATAVSAWPRELRAVASDLTSSWKIAFGTMGVTVDELGISYSINSEKDGLRTEQDLAWKKITGTDKLNKEWELAVGQASKAKLWALNLLEGFSFDASPSLLAQFMELAQKAAKVDKNWLLSSAKKSQQLAPLLGKLLASLAKLSVLEKALTQTQTHLDEALRSARQTADFIATTLASLAAPADTQPTILAATLSNEINEISGETWVKSMHRPAELNDQKAFRGAVLAGATGLTKNGLLEVLDLPATANAAEIAAELVREPAEVSVGGGKAGAKQVAPIHWQRSAPAGPTKQYFYRLLPQVDPATEAELDQKAGEIATLFTEKKLTIAFETMGAIGLYVMAFHGMSLSSEGGNDFFSAPKYMLRSMLSYVQKELQRWESNPAMIGISASGNYNVAAAGAIGEPLDLTALIVSGLKDEEIAKLASLYLIYSRNLPEDNRIMDSAEAVLQHSTTLREKL